MVKGEADGIVRIIPELCVGCRACLEACPWKVPQWDATRGKVVKCDQCGDRLAQGLEPTCVAGCTTHALSFSMANDGLRKARMHYAKSLLVSGKPG